jgi:hypothetical protein
MESMAQKIDWLDGYDPVASGEQSKYGIDLEGLRYNLTLTPEQRFEQHQAALKFSLAIRDAGRADRLKQANCRSK